MGFIVDVREFVATKVCFPDNDERRFPTGGGVGDTGAVTVAVLLPFTLPLILLS